MEIKFAEINLGDILEVQFAGNEKVYRTIALNNPPVVVELKVFTDFGIGSHFVKEHDLVYVNRLGNATTM